MAKGHEPPANPPAGSQLLDVALSCTATRCSVTEIRLRIKTPNVEAVRELVERELWCPVCGTRATIAWMQLAAVTERSDE